MMKFIFDWIKLLEIRETWITSRDVLHSSRLYACKDTLCHNQRICEMKYKKNTQNTLILDHFEPCSTLLMKPHDEIIQNS